MLTGLLVARPRWRSAFVGAVVTGTFVSGFLQGFLLFLALPVNLGRPFGAPVRSACGGAGLAGSQARSMNQARRTVERPGAQEWVPADADLDALRAAAPACRGCELWEPATQVVFSAGNPHAAVALVGEQPGDVEDQQGVPFVGPAGRLLQRAVDDAGLDRADLYVTNAVKHFRFTARGKRRIHATPELAHITACKPWLTAELRIVDPRLVVVLGATAAKALLGAQFRVTRHRGELITVETTRGPRRFVPTVHPSSVLRVPDDERAAAYDALVADLRVAATALAA